MRTQLSACTCTCVTGHQWRVSFPERFANSLLPKIAVFGCSVAAGFDITVSVVVAVKLSTLRILSLTPASVNSTCWFPAIYSKGRERDGIVFLTGHLPVSSLNLTFRNLVKLKLDKYNFLLGAKSLQMKPNVEGSERVMCNEVVFLLEHALALQNSETFS